MGILEFFIPAIKVRKTPDFSRNPVFLCGSYDKLIQFYSVIQCNTYCYNASFFKVCIVQPHKASFFPQTRRFRYNFRLKSCPLAKVHEVNTILQKSAMQQLIAVALAGTYMSLPNGMNHIRSTYTTHGVK